MSKEDCNQCYVANASSVGIAVIPHRVQTAVVLAKTPVSALRERHVEPAVRSSHAHTTTMRALEAGVLLRVRHLYQQSKTAVGNLCFGRFGPLRRWKLSRRSVSCRARRGSL